MNAVGRRAVWAAIALCLAGVCTLHAASARTACLAPIDAGDDGPQPRDIHYVIDTANKKVTVTACIVSNGVQYSQLEAAVSIFDSSGRYLKRNVQGLGGVAQTVNAGPANPKIVATVAIDFDIDIKSADQLLNFVVVGLEWTPCTPISAGQCDPGESAGASFLREVTLPTPDGNGKR